MKREASKPGEDLVYKQRPYLDTSGCIEEPRGKGKKESPHPQRSKGQGGSLPPSRGKGERESLVFFFVERKASYPLSGLFCTLLLFYALLLFCALHYVFDFSERIIPLS